MVLRDLEDMSYEEIAGVLGLPGGTVKSRLLRGREMLRRTFREKPMVRGQRNGARADQPERRVLRADVFRELRRIESCGVDDVWKMPGETAERAPGAIADTFATSDL